MNDIKRKKLLRVFENGKSAGLEIYDVKNLIDKNVYIPEGYELQFPLEVEKTIIQNRLERE